MLRQAGRITHAGRMWLAEDDAAPERRRNAEHEFGSRAHGVCDGARALKSNDAPASRRHERGAQ